ncbi:MAG TPA: nucleotidyltransferase [Thermoleophilaceae bacterium]
MGQDLPFKAMGNALKKATAALRDGGVPFVVGGSLASWARGGPEPRHDLDIMVKPEDAENALAHLEQAGMRSERPPEGWLFKAWDGDVMVDVIFCPKGLKMTDEVIERAEEIDVLAIRMPVMALEDMLTTKLLSLDEHSLSYTSLVQIARALREQIDWPSLRERTAASPYAKAFFVLAEELGLCEPPSMAGGRTHVRVLGAPAATSGR